MRNLNENEINEVTGAGLKEVAEKLRDYFEKVAREQLRRMQGDGFGN